MLCEKATDEMGTEVPFVLILVLMEDALRAVASEIDLHKEVKS